MPSKEDCFNADLLQSTKDAGISCGFIEIHLNFQSGKKLNFNTCNLFNPEMAEKQAQQQEISELRNQMNEMSKNMALLIEQLKFKGGKTNENVGN
jgi:hypothetical protein